MTDQAKIQPRQVQAYQTLRAVAIDAAATCGAQIGVNLLLPDGTVGTLAQLQALFGKGTAGTAITTTDDVEEGQYNLWFTSRRAQDAVGGILADSANVTLSYVGGTSITADLANVSVASGGTLKKRTFDAKGRLSQESAATTDDLAESATPTNLWFTAARVRAVVLTGLSLTTSAVIAATDTVLQALGKLQAQITSNLLPKGYIEGLQMQWVSGTALTVTTGAAYIEWSSSVLRATSAIAKTGLSLTASTFYHVYLYSNAGTPDIEIVTTAPAAAYNGTARSKTGDTSRRYLGSIRANSSGSIVNFLMSGSRIVYRGDVASGFAPSSDGFRVLTSGTSTTDVSISCSELVPTTSRLANLRLQSTSTAGGFRVKQSDGTYVATGAAGETISPGGLGIFDFPLNALQQLIYFFSSTPSGGGGFIDVAGYVFER